MSAHYWCKWAGWGIMVLLSIWYSVSVRGEDAPPSGSRPVDSYGDLLPEEAVARVGSVRLRHGAQVDAVGFTSNGNEIVSIAGDALRVWSSKDGKPNGRSDFDLAAPFLNAAALSLNGQLAAVVGGLTTIHILDVQTRKSLRDINLLKATGNALAFSPDGHLLVSGDTEGRIWVWDVDSGKQVFSLEGHKKAITALAVTFDGTRLLSGSEDSSIRIWDLKARKETDVLSGHRDAIKALSMSQHSEILASSSADSTIRIWSLRSKKEVRQIDDGISNDITSLILSQNGKTLIGGGYGYLSFWDAETGKLLRRISGHSSPIRALAIDATGTKLISGGDDGAVRVWTIRTGVELHSVQGPRGPITYIAFTPNGKALCSASRHRLDETISSWDLHEFPRTRFLKSTQAYACSLAPDGKSVAAATAPDTGQGMRIATLHFPELTDAHHSPLFHAIYRSIAYSSDGATIFCGAHGNQLHVFSANKCDKIRSMSVGDQSTSRVRWVRSIAVSPNGKYLAVSSGDSVYLLNPANGDNIKSFRLQSSLSPVAFSPQKTLLAFPSPKPGEIVFWDALHDPPPPVKLPGVGFYISAIAFSPDGKCLAIGTSKGEIVMLDPPTRTITQRFRGHLGSVRCLTFFPNRKIIASGGDDMTILFWKLRE